MNHTPANVEPSISALSPFNPCLTLPLTPGPVVLSAGYAARLSMLLAYSARFLELEADPIPAGASTTLAARLTAEAGHLAELLKADYPATSDGLPVPISRAEQLARALDGQ